jgi:hypothetical protein
MYNRIGRLKKYLPRRSLGEVSQIYSMLSYLATLFYPINIINIHPLAYLIKPFQVGALIYKPLAV